MSERERPFEQTVSLIRRARGGESQALGELIQRYQDVLLARVRRQMGVELRDFAESSDLLQELFVDIVEGFEKLELRDEEAFLRWATRVAQNNARDLARRRRYRAMQMLATSMGGGGDTTPEGAAQQKEEVERLERALEELPEAYREVIELRDLGGLAYEEIARRMGRPSAAAAQMTHARAIAKLTQALGKRP